MVVLWGRFLISIDRSGGGERWRSSFFALHRRGAVFGTTLSVHVPGRAVVKSVWMSICRTGLWCLVDLTHPEKVHVLKRVCSQVTQAPPRFVSHFRDVGVKLTRKLNTVKYVDETPTSPHQFTHPLQSPHEKAFVPTYFQTYEGSLTGRRMVTQLSAALSLLQSTSTALLHNSPRRCVGCSRVQRSEPRHKAPTPFQKTTTSYTCFVLQYCL